MGTTRRRRIRTYRQQLRADEIRRHETRATAEVERIRRFDDALAKLILPAAVAVTVLVAIAVLVA